MVRKFRYDALARMGQRHGARCLKQPARTSSNRVHSRRPQVQMANPPKDAATASACICQRALRVLPPLWCIELPLPRSLQGLELLFLCLGVALLHKYMGVPYR